VSSELILAVLKLQELVFKDTLAYGDQRGLYIIKDTKTNIEYIGVSGIGIAEVGSHQSGKVSVRDER
jgi:hypothetical protein